MGRAIDGGLQKRVTVILDGDPVGRKVKLAFGGKGRRWRTVGGIARDAGLPRDVVRDYIAERNQCFVTPRVSPGGKKLYGIRLDDLDQDFPSRQSQVAGG